MNSTTTDFYHSTQAACNQVTSATPQPFFQPIAYHSSSGNSFCTKITRINTRARNKIIDFNKVVDTELALSKAKALISHLENACTQLQSLKKTNQGHLQELRCISSEYLDIIYLLTNMKKTKEFLAIPLYNHEMPASTILRSVVKTVQSIYGYVGSYFRFPSADAAFDIASDFDSNSWRNYCERGEDTACYASAALQIKEGNLEQATRDFERAQRDNPWLFSQFRPDMKCYYIQGILRYWLSIDTFSLKRADELFQSSNLPDEDAGRCLINVAISSERLDIARTYFKERLQHENTPLDHLRLSLIYYSENNIPDWSRELQKSFASKDSELLSYLRGIFCAIEPTQKSLASILEEKAAVLQERYHVHASKAENLATGIILLFSQEPKRALPFLNNVVKESGQVDEISLRLNTYLLGNSKRNIEELFEILQLKRKEGAEAPIFDSDTTEGAELISSAYLAAVCQLLLKQEEVRLGFFRTLFK